MVLIIDNYDSFTYNLAQYFQMLGQEVVVYLHDAISIAEIVALDPDYIVLSPGPNSPFEAGISLDVIKQLHRDYPILGICLGHQCIAVAFGGKTVAAPEVVHGKTSLIEHEGVGLFAEIERPFLATRYHSLVVDEGSLPDCFQIDAWSNGIIMAISHREYPLFGVQFHPEAILSEFGMELLGAFLIRTRTNQKKTSLRKR